LRKRLTPDDWLATLTPREIQWVYESLIKKKVVSARDDHSSADLKALISDRLHRSRNADDLFKQCKNGIRTRRCREKTKKSTYAFRLTENEANKLQAMASAAKTNRTEIIRRLIRNGPEMLCAIDQQEEVNLRAQRDLTLKGKDMEKLAEAAKALANQNARMLGMAQSLLAHHGIKWEQPSFSQLQLGMAYYHLIEAEMEKFYEEEKRKLKKQLHHLDRSIPRPTHPRNEKAQEDSLKAHDKGMGQSVGQGQE